MFVVLPPALWLGGCAARVSESSSSGGAPPSPAADGGATESWFEMTTEGQLRIIRSNGIPNHATGKFPNAHCPEALKPQNYRFQMPLAPEKASAVTDLCPIGKQTYRFGVAIDGVTFDPSGPWYHGGNTYEWHFEATAKLPRYALGVDDNNAHTQAGGQYHYHGVPTGLIEALRATKPTGMLLVGYAADGFPIYAADVPRDPKDLASPIVQARSSFRIRQGTRSSAPGGAFDGTFEQDYEYVAGLGDLDECNGREGVTPEYPNGTYYYVISENYPYIPRQFRGTPDDSFLYGPKAGPTEPGGALAPLPPDLANYTPG
jgi:hypothetical protein